MRSTCHFRFKGIKVPKYSRTNAAVLKKLNNFGGGYLAIIRSRGFFAKTFHQHANAEGANKLLNLQASEIGYFPIEADYAEIIFSRARHFEVLNARCKVDLNTGLTQLYQPKRMRNVLFSFRLFTFLEDLSYSAHAGRIFMPSMAKILIDAFYLKDFIFLESSALSHRQVSAKDFTNMKLEFLRREIKLIDRHLEACDKFLALQSRYNNPNSLNSLNIDSGTSSLSSTSISPGACSPFKYRQP